MVYFRNACSGTDVSDLIYLPVLFWFWLRIDTVDRCFCHDTVEEIIDALVSIKQYFFTRYLIELDDGEYLKK